MKHSIQEVINYLEQWAPTSLSESYDNSGLLTGDSNSLVTGILTTLDCIESVVDEAINTNCNLIVSHHPIIFGGLKSITGKNHIEKTIIKAIKHNIAIYAIHTNLDNVLDGINQTISQRLSLTNIKTLRKKKQYLKKVICFLPTSSLEKVRQALTEAGGGHIGHYSHCSFSSVGKGSFMPKEGASPTTGEIDKLHQSEEVKLEMVFPFYLEKTIIKALVSNHPYEEVAYDIVSIDNTNYNIGSGVIGTLDAPVDTLYFFKELKNKLGLTTFKHTSLCKQEIRTVALCGGSGSFLLSDAIAQNADVFITGDFKYHEFFMAENKLIICDIGHYESEQFAKKLISQYLKKKFSNFAINNSKINTNPIKYF